VGTGIPSGDLSPRGMVLGKKFPPQMFMGIPIENFFRRGDGDREQKPDEEFHIAISNKGLGEQISGTIDR
jgi:hypothetical protein